MTRRVTDPEGSKSFSSLYRCAAPAECLNVAGSKDSPVCAVLGSREAMNAKLPGALEKLDRGAYEQYCEHKSILEIMQDELDAIIERLMNDGGAADGRDPGRAESLCWAIALIENPYAPNMDAVKGQAMLRYEPSVREEESDAEAD